MAQYDIFYHRGAASFGGIEIQPPLPDWTEVRAVSASINFLANNTTVRPDAAGDLKHVSLMYESNSSEQGTHYAVVPEADVSFSENLELLKVVADRVGSMLTQSRHEVTVQHRDEWDGSLGGSSGVPIQGAAAATFVELPSPPADT